MNVKEIYFEMRKATPWMRAEWCLAMARSRAARLNNISR
jgi:hypothetical protein